MGNKLIYQLSALLLAIGVCIGQDCLTSNDARAPLPSSKDSLYNGQQEFSLNLLQAVNQLSPDANILFSPYSTYHALLMAYFISSNTTETYLKKVLKLGPQQTKVDVYSAYKFDKLLTQLRTNDGQYEFTNANRIYVDQSVIVRQCMLTLFADELQTQNFKVNPEAGRKKINEWVEQQTKDMIKDLLPPGSLDQTTTLVLANAAYFKGFWENKFDPDLTKLDVFYINPSKRTFVNMMHVEGTFNHDISEELKAHILELPYKGSDISMYILLPPFVSEDGVATILKRLTLEKFKSIVGEQTTLLPRTVEVSLPKFSLDYSIELVPILDSMGVGNLFHDDSDLSQLTGNKDVKLGSGIHKARIEVDENGAKAAAATALFSFRMIQDEPVVPFTCNQPFVFLLYNKRTTAILFLGVYRKPTAT